MTSSKSFHEACRREVRGGPLAEAARLRRFYGGEPGARPEKKRAGALARKGEGHGCDSRSSARGNDPLAARGE